MKIVKKTKPAQYLKTILATYAYMDNMGLDGWAWEFIRRNERYRKAYEHIVQLLNTEGITIEIGRQALAELWRISEEYGIYPLTSNCRPFKDHSRPYIPAPSNSYYELSEGDKPIVLRSTGVVLYKDEDLEKKIMQTGFDKNNDKMKKQMMWLIRSSLAPGLPQNTLYIGISRHANMKTVKKEVAEIIRAHVKGKKRNIQYRPDEWKKYLQVYDLFDLFPTKELAEHIFSFIENKHPDYRGNKYVRRYRAKAQSLIEGGFAEFLP